MANRKYRFTSRLRTSELYAGGKRGGTLGDLKKHGDYTVIMYFDGRYPSDKRHRGLRDKSVANIAQMLMSGTMGGSLHYSQTDSKTSNYHGHKIQRWPFWDDCKRAHLTEWIDAVRSACAGAKGKIYTKMLALAYKMKDQLKETIHATEAPSLADRTLKNKLRRGLGLERARHPLEETLRLLKSVNTLVVKTSSLSDTRKYKEYEQTTRPYRDRTFNAPKPERPSVTAARHETPVESVRNFTQEDGIIKDIFSSEEDMLNYLEGPLDEEEEE